MKHLKLFNDVASYEAWKTSEEYVLPNVSYIEEVKGVAFNPKLRYLIKAVCNATSDNMKLFKMSNNDSLNALVSLKVDGKNIQFEPVKNTVNKIDVLSENITDVEITYVSEGYCIEITAKYPTTYISNVIPAKSWGFKIKDSNYVINDNTKICHLKMPSYNTSNTRAAIDLRSINELFDTTDNITFNGNDILVSMMNSVAYGGELSGMVLCEVDENNNITFIDTECLVSDTTGGLNMYDFETTGTHHVEIELLTDIIQDSFFNFSCITDIEICDGFTTIGDTVFGACEYLKSVILPKTINTLEWGVFNGCSSMQEITCYALIAPVTYGSIGNSEIPVVFKYPKGADYTEFINVLPSSWTAVEF